MSALIDLTGKRFGKLIVIIRHGTGSTPTLWDCICDCGERRTIQSQDLRESCIKSCGCGRRRRPYEGLYNCFTAQSNKSHLIDLSYENFLEFTKTNECVYCGEKVTWAKFYPQKFGQNYNLDRKDNSLGYTKGNCAVCCWSCNDIKSDRFTYEQMLQIGALIKSWKNLAT